MEEDDEIKGDGNSYDFGARMYDNRLGKFLSLDPLYRAFPSKSGYTFASNSPICAIDKNGEFTIFVNGYIYGAIPGPVDDIAPKRPYWSESSKDPNEFINAAHKYFGDMNATYVNGSGNGIASTAAGRYADGKDYAEKVLIPQLKIYIKKSKGTADEVKEINFATHSMGAAYSEGMIEAMMADPELKSLMENGEIVHFSACDGADINISENSKNLERSQINYTGDQTLLKADGPIDGMMGGERIKGVQRYGVVLADLKILHPYAYEHNMNHDFHFDSKTYDDAWKALDYLNTKLKSSPQLNNKLILILSSNVI